MDKDYICQFAIKYKVIKLDKKHFLLYPMTLKKGEETEQGFLSEDGELLPFCMTKDDLKNKYVVDNIYANDELEYLYDDFDERDVDFLGEYFFNDYKNAVMIINTDDVDQEQIMYRNFVDLKILDVHDSNSIFYMDHSIPSMVINQTVADEILNCENMDELKLLITKYQRQLISLKKENENKNVTRVSINNGKVEYFECNGIVKYPDEFMNQKNSSSNVVSSDISYQGLRNYIKERIFGHENEIDTFAQKLYMNYTAEEGETVESILLVGPTGTGKTETVRAACNYLNIPMVEFNASNLNAEGIVGTSIESLMIALYEAAGGDIVRAQRGLVFLDEFDKLSDSAGLETKGPVKNILLTFTGGGSFPISNNRYNFMFDSKMTNKIYAGVFDRIIDKSNPIGFAATKIIQGLGSEEDIRKKIVEKKYYSHEELSRISTILPYNEIDRETKKKILMESKLSEFVKKRDRYLRQFGIELIAEDSYVDAVLDSLSKTSTGMRSVNNFVKKTINEAEKTILVGETEGYKKLVLTKETAENPRKFDLGK